MAKAIRFEKGTIVAGRFELDEPLGDGSTGVVYRATDKTSGRVCAVRLIAPELVGDRLAADKFLAAAELIQRVGAHPNTAEIYDSGLDGVSGHAYLAMPLVEGEDLGTWAKNNASLHETALRSLFQQLGAALDHAHETGLLHGHLTCSDVLVSKNAAGAWALCVLDFGMATLCAASAQPTALQRVPQYCAPEQLGNSMRAMAAEKGFNTATVSSRATDVFALGLLAYEVLTGSNIGTYWGASDVGDLMVKIVMEPRANPTERAGLDAMKLPRGFDTWFKRCTAHDAADRFERAGEATQVLVALLNGDTSTLDAYRRAPQSTEVMKPLAVAPSAPLATVTPGQTDVMPPLAAAPGETLNAAPPQGLVYEQHGPFGALSAAGNANAPILAQQGPTATPNTSNNTGMFLMFGGLVALLVVLGGGGFLAYRSLRADAETSSDEVRSTDDDDGRARARRRRQRRPPEPSPVSHETAAVAVRADDPKWGHALAPVTIVVFSDFQCPYCSRVEATLKALRTKYGEDKLRIVWKDFPLPFHKQAAQAHVAARAVYELGGDKAFWRFHELAFNDQKALTESHFEIWATTAGVSLSKFQKVVTDLKIRMRMELNITDGKAYGVRGTPSFFINGKFQSGAQSQSTFEREIDAELLEAAKLVSAGTAKNRIYIERAASNFGSGGPVASATAVPVPSAKPPADTTTVWKVPVHKDDPFRGNRDAVVTIVQFADYQCPYCVKVEPTLRKLLVDYGAKLRLVWKDNPLPFHKRAKPAAIAAREAYAQKGNAGFWSMHDALIDNPKKLEDVDLWGYAATVGVDVGKVKSAVSSNKYQNVIDRSQNEADGFNAPDTPHFFINGRRLVGAQSEAAFKAIIDQEVIRGAKLLATGISPSRLYDELTQGGMQPRNALVKMVVPAPPADAPFKGGARAIVEIQAFSDFQCPFCARVGPTLTKVLATYGDKVKIIWRHHPLPFHKEAALAHEAAVEAYVQKGNSGFWKMHDKLFAGQKALLRPDLERYASQIGLDMKKFRAALNDRRHRARVNADVQVSKVAGIHGTPGFMVNDYFLSGAQPFAKFKKVIDLALAEAP